MQTAESNRKYKILFVDDEPRITAALNAIFRREYTVFTANSGAQALALLEQQNVDVVVSDQRMPKMLGNQLLAQISKTFPQTMRILLTGFTDRAAIVDSINEGEIYRFINKPWRNDELKEVIAEAALASENSVEAVSSSAPESDVDRALLMVESSEGVRNQIRRISKRDNIMVYGTQNLEQAVAAGVQRESIGVMIFGFAYRPKPTLEAIHALKRARPDLVTIVLAQEYDTQIAIDLINQGQVHKYLVLPLEEEMLAITVSEAFRKHYFLKHNQTAQIRYKVETRSGRIISGLQEVFSRLVGSATS